MQEIMLEATRLGHRLMRNNVGRAAYVRGGAVSTVPYGVGGPGGADLIGWSMRRPEYLQGPDDCIFTAIECKGPRTRVTPEQQQFIDAVRAAGGIAGICRSVEDYRKLVGTP